MTLPSRRDRVLGGRYLLIEPIGQGGMAVVWRAHDRILDRGVAVKILSDSSQRFRDKLRTEATAIGRLRNAHIAHIYDYGETVGTDRQTLPYLVMELVDGETLARRLAREPALTWREAVDIVAQVAAAIAAAHAEGLVHRDIKPDNVLLTADGVKLIDFGISALVGSPDVEEDGQVLGTVAYLAPERLTGSRVGPAADVYALGILLYRMIAGTLPWRVQDQAELIDMHLNYDPNPLPEIANMPAALGTVCEDCLLKDPAWRPSAGELATVLTRLANLPEPAAVATGEIATGTVAAGAGAAGTGAAGAGAAGPVPVSQPTAARHRGRRMVAVLAVAAAVAVAFLVWNGGGGGSRATAGALPSNVPCVADFSITQDWGSGFTASLTIVNMGATVHGWHIAFNFTGNQQITTGPEAAVTVTAATKLQQSVMVRQSGVTVSAADPDQTLDRHDSVTLPVTGRYTGSNPIPLDYRLNDQECMAQVAGAVGHPTPGPGGTIPATGGYPGGWTPGGTGSPMPPLPGPPVVPGSTAPGSSTGSTGSTGTPGSPPTPAPSPSPHPTPSSHPTPDPRPTPDPPVTESSRGTPTRSPQPTRDHTLWTTPSGWREQ